MNAATRGKNQFLLGGDLPINRLGFGAMRLPTNGFRGPARDPEIGRAVLGGSGKSRSGGIVGSLVRGVLGSLFK